MCEIDDTSKHASYFGSSELRSVQPGCGLCMIVLGPMVEWVSIGLWLSSSPGAQGKCQYLQLGKGTLVRKAVLHKDNVTSLLYTS